MLVMLVRAHRTIDFFVEDFHNFFAEDFCNFFAEDFHDFFAKKFSLAEILGS